MVYATAVNTVGSVFGVDRFGCTFTRKSAGHGTNGTAHHRTHGACKRGSHSGAAKSSRYSAGTGANRMRRGLVALLLRIHCCCNAFTRCTFRNRAAHTADHSTHWPAKGCTDCRACYGPASSAHTSTCGMTSWRVGVFSIDNGSIIFKVGWISGVRDFRGSFAHKSASNSANGSADYSTHWPTHNRARCGPGNAAGCCPGSCSNRMSTRRPG